MRRIGGRFLWAGMLALVAGCASGPQREPVVGDADRGNTTLIVENAPGAGSLTIYALPDLGGRMFVGNVGAGQTATLRFNVRSPGSFRFIAETLSRGTAASNPVFFSPGATIRWNLSSNIATVSN